MRTDLVHLLFGISPFPYAEAALTDIEWPTYPLFELKPIVETPFRVAASFTATR